MPELRKATLLEIDNDNQPAAGQQAVPVQFNPASLRLQFGNQSEGAKQAGRQARQYTGTGSTTLTVELLFDTADEGSTAVPRSVLERTQDVERFMTPKSVRGSNQAPPRLRFQWANLIVDGVMETLSVDLEHFAHDGTPLRAKASITVKGQHPEFQFNQAGPGANSAVGATPALAAQASLGLPGAGGLSLGGSLGVSLGIGGGIGLAIGAGVGVGAGASVMAALEGESLAQLSQRAGIDPAAWRALSAGVGNPLSLPAGTPVAVPAAASATLGAGAAAGVQSAAPASTAARVGLQQSGAGASAVAAALQRGHALAGAGGVGAALETVKADAGLAGAASARRDFGNAGGAAPAGATVDPLTGAATTPGQRNQLFSLRADPRAGGWGRGVPLRDRVQIGHDSRANLLSGQAVVKRASDGLPPTTGDPGVPGWVALPLSAASAGALSRRHHRSCRCGCND